MTGYLDVDGTGPTGIQLEVTFQFSRVLFRIRDVSPTKYPFIARLISTSNPLFASL